jgi:type II secretory ATPase GspE/PulE/Tfp pilus assembly ATPase PilB-like protein
MRQTSVNEVARMDFANGIRSIMRQDPDIILVGEVRDKETAEMAFRAAMTGHQVFTTLHTNSALGAFPRLYDIGIQPDIMAGNIIAVIAQRLVRTLCAQCKEAYAPSREERMLLGEFADQATRLHRAAGCKHCDNKGYKGRTPVMEVLVMDGDMDELIARRSTAKELRTAAMAKGFRPLAEAGLQRVVDGVTALAELARAVDLTGRYG